MNNEGLKLAFAYLRLSNEEQSAGGESSSIQSQRLLIEQYCQRSGIALAREFVDDGWSGGNFDRPAFKEMIARLLEGGADVVVTKDLSRLGRDMVESCYYAEQFFPEHGVRYIAINDHFDTARDSANVMVPFVYAMNEVYLRDGSRKVREVLKSKRESGQYCACPPYGYRKDPARPHSLTPDEMTAPVVLRVFRAAAAGDSSRKIALELNADGVIPPLKYRVLYRDNFSEAGAARASDTWNYTTVKRILKNRVYLGHTLLGKSKKASVKSRKKISVPAEEWVVHENTHPPIVSEELFRLAQMNLGRGTARHNAFAPVRKSIFSGVAVCARCGHALCSCGTVYNGEREKYWYLSCTHQRRDIPQPCEGVRIRYADLMEVVRQDLNRLLSLDSRGIEALVSAAVRQAEGTEAGNRSEAFRQSAAARLGQIDRMVAKLYADNAAGHLSDERLHRMVAELEREASGLTAALAEPDSASRAGQTARRYEQFFALARDVTRVETLDRDTLVTFIDRIEVGPKEYGDSGENTARGGAPFTQTIRIFYKFIGELGPSPSEPAELLKSS